jgi:hypothetical protein
MPAPLTRALEQRRLAREELVRAQHLDQRRAVALVLDHGDAAQHRQAGEQPCAVVGEHGGEPAPHREVVCRQGAGVLAGADDEHLDEAALDLAVKVGVRLDAVDDDHAAGLGEVAGRPYGHPEGALADGYDVHGRDDRGADRRLRHAQLLEHGALPCGRRAAVAAHARRDEGVAARRMDGGDRRAQHGRQVGDASAAGRDRDACSARHQAMQTDALQPLRDLRGDVHRCPPGVQLVHELQKGALVLQTGLSHVVGGIVAEPTTSHTNPKEA